MAGWAIFEAMPSKGTAAALLTPKAQQIYYPQTLLYDSQYDWTRAAAAASEGLRLWDEEHPQGTDVDPTEQPRRVALLFRRGLANMAHRAA